MAYDLEEQEELDVIKDWWKRNSKYVAALVVAVAVVFSTYQGWKYYQHKQAVEASALYDQLTRHDVKDIKNIRSLSAQLMEKYSGTVYATRGALLAAKANYEGNDAKSAMAQLQWAMEHAKEEQIRSIAQLQLAAVQLDQKQYDVALKTLADKHDAAFDGLFADLKGDVLVAQGKPADAKAAYKDALSKLDAQGHYRVYTEHKLEALGS